MTVLAKFNTEVIVSGVDYRIWNLIQFLLNFRSCLLISYLEISTYSGEPYDIQLYRWLAGR